MGANDFLQLTLYGLALLALVKPLGWYMATVYEGRAWALGRLLAPVERGLYRLLGIAEGDEMDWKQYALAMLGFNLLGVILLYALLRVQGALPLNPEGLGGVEPHTAFNIAVSFVSNTNWQSYGGETTLSYLTQMVGLTVQNFVSAATGMAVLVALVRGLARRTTEAIGNFWVDMTRSTLYILLPLSLLLALLLASQGVVQSFDAYATVPLVEPLVVNGETVTAQRIALGPAASQVAIKQLGTNGGGFFNANSAHPLENPTPLSNFLQMLAILLIPAALPYTFGRMVGDTRQGWAILAAMGTIFVTLLVVPIWAELGGNPLLTALGTAPGGGNMEGKEVRFGIVNAALWATATTAASNGSVNAMHDSFMPLGGLVPMWLMQLGEVIFGGVGSGLYGMLLFALIAVFVSGLMVGRTPEYLGKKVEATEMKWAMIAILVPSLVTLLATAITVVTPSGVASIQDAGPHGFSEALYAFSSMGNNNGSAFGGFNANVPLVNSLGGLAMLFARFWVAIPALAIAGSLARKKQLPVGPGTLPTDTPLFVVMLASVVVVVGALTFIPALALGPVVEHLTIFE